MGIRLETEKLKSLLSQSWPLEFSGENAHLEKDFKKEFLSRSAVFTRLALCIGLIFYSVFGFLDAILAPEQKYQLWFIRYAVVGPLLIILILVSFLKPFRKSSEILGVIALIAAGSGISIMVAISRPPASYSYYAGIILVLMLGYGFVRIRFKWAVLTGWLNVLIYEIIAIFIVNTPRETLINNNFFFISANLIGMLSCYAVEFYIRRNYLFAIMLKKERETVSHLNENLEKIVNRRTAELVDVNQTLTKEIEARNNAEEESKELETKLQQAQKMESIGIFAGGIAHDFNNILTSILGYSELALDISEEESEMESHLSMIFSSAQRAKELVRQILSFARKSEQKVEAIRVDLILEEVLKFIRSTLPATIEIKQSINCDACIMGNSTQVHQVFMNLFTNAAQAMGTDSGVLDVKLNCIDARQLDDTSLICQASQYIVIQIEDTGSGIPEDKLNTVFEPYFTTKKMGEGTGLGLAVVHGIISSYGGQIHVKSVVNEGTEFTIYLPVTEKREDSLSGKMIGLPEGNERILLVDDEPLIANYSELILKDLGYSVTSVTDSRQALTLIQEKSQDFDLLITDMMMPHYNGEQLCDKTADLRPDLPMIICSGYSDNVLSSKAVKNNKRTYLSKPFSRSEIAQAIRRALE
ncbi:MAG: ATP-binding protein [Spirochaetales bacterium]|nr:ATP-binding protein [Spirochaetales bacterium]